MSDFIFIKRVPELGGIAVHRDITDLVRFSGTIEIDVGTIPTKIYNSVCNALRRGWQTQQSGPVAGLLRVLTSKDSIPMSYVGITKFRLELNQGMAVEVEKELRAFGAMSDGQWVKNMRRYPDSDNRSRAIVHSYTYGGDPCKIPRVMLERWHEPTWHLREPLLNYFMSKPTLTYTLEKH